MPPFQPVPARVAFPDLEARILDFWREHDVFKRSVDERAGAPVFSFYEGPPTANGNPGIHHVLARVFKDLIPRYKTMRGYRVPRKGGWDTHGLPVELEVERQLGLRSKPDIEAYGVEAFNRQCRESVFRYVAEWERMTERIGFWVDLSDAYVTYSREYVESCWWIFKQLWDHDLMFRDYRTTPHCPRCETSLSSHEIALGYKEDTPDPSVFVRFRVPPAEVRRAFGEGARARLGSGGPTALSNLVPPGAQLSFLAWTTTPWTLPGNTALAVNADAEYALAAVGDERIVVAQARVADVLGAEARTLAVVRGRDLVGMRYEPLYDAARWPGVQPLVFRDGRWQPPPDGDALPARRVVAADFVATDDGTGIVHIAPAFGEDDHQLGRREGLLFLQPVSTSGRLVGGPWDGEFVKDADPLITADLQSRGLLWRAGRIRHTYPFCWRCDTPVLYYAKPSWYIRTTAVRDALVAANRDIHWVPEHIRDGRFGEWLEGNVDWAVSRERYWGTPLPLWTCAACGATECIGSYAELHARSGAAPSGSDGEIADPHRPYVDAVTFACTSDGCSGTMRRVPEVADAWFDSGAMPYAQWHYPFEHADTFAARFPADYICEAVDQTRGWFYTLHALATLLHRTEDAPESLAYRNVICLGHILDGDGLKMSKSRGNVVDPWTVLDAHGADALRWYLYTASPPGNSRRFSAELVAETSRRFLATLWNTYSFFVTYANIANFDPAGDSPPVPQRADLDRWVLSELARTVQQVTAALDAYEPADAARPIEQFVEQLSNWYVRRSRRRFWKSDDSADTQAALWTLYKCLVTVTRLLAPFTPFVAEELHRNLIANRLPGAADSVHLEAWPNDPDVETENLSVDQLAQQGPRALGTVGARSARVTFGGSSDSGHATHVRVDVYRGSLTPEEAHRVLTRFVPYVLVDDNLTTDIELVQRLVSLGRAARQQANVRVRQPLAELVVVVRTAEERDAVERFAEEIKDELNVKRVTPGDGADPRLAYTLRPNLPTLGPRFGRELGAVRQALAQADPAAVAARRRAGEPLGVGSFDLTAADVLVSVAATDGWSAAEEAGYVALLDTRVTPDLAAEGLARELVRRLQELRRDAGLDVTDRIRVAWQASAGRDAVAAALAAHGAYLAAEVLALDLAEAPPATLGPAPATAAAALDGAEVTLALVRA
jgi:isoleucyl-tRNA synthetase